MYRAVKLPRRQFDVLTKFLRETIANPKISHRVRFAAAERLDGLYARHMLYEDKAAARKERAELRALATQSPVGANAPQKSPSEVDAPEDSEDQQVQDVFARLMSKGKADAIAD